MVEKSLELLFVNQQGKLVSITVENPVEPINPEQVSSVMDTILAANVFTSSGGEFVAKHGARLLSSEVTEIPLA